MKSGIYLIKNIQNNKVYIGSAINIPKRWTEHKRNLKKGKHHSRHLQSAWNIYGEQNFKFEILQEVSNFEHLLAYEQVYLDYYKSYEDEKGYNICKVVGSRLGTKHSEEAKQKISEAAKNVSEEARKKMSEAAKGRMSSEKARNKLSEKCKGRLFSEEHKKKLSEAGKGRIFSEQHKQKLREANTGKKHTEESKRKMSEGNKNRKDNKFYSFIESKKKYIVRIFKNYIGLYNTEEEAKQAVIINLEKLKVQEIVSS